MPSPEIANWFRDALREAFADITGHQRRQAATLAKRQSELKGMQDRLLNVFLAGAVDEATFRAKSAELGGQMAVVEQSIRKLGTKVTCRNEVAQAIFDWAQTVPDTWRGSNKTTRRDILDLICLNRTLGDVTLYAPKRKPFDILAKGLKTENSRGDWI
jgi:hypothetical protein